MIYAIIILSITVLLMFLVIAVLAIKCVDLNASFDVVVEQLREKEETFGRAQKLVLDKFDYLVPSSKLYLEIAEHEMRKEQDDV